MDVWGIVLAGGEGRRFGGHKQFELLGGVTLLEHAINLGRLSCSHVVVVVPQATENLRCSADLVVVGGPERADSVRAGLAALPDSAERVLIHDAAHPLAAPRLFHEAVAGCTDLVAGCLPLLALANTMAWVDGGIVQRAQSKEGVFTMQMPMVFWVDKLRDAHLASRDTTDDASLMVGLGHPMSYIPGEPDNLHITTPSDLRLAAAILQARQDLPAATSPTASAAAQTPMS